MMSGKAIKRAMVVVTAVGTALLAAGTAHANGPFPTSVSPEGGPFPSNSAPEGGPFPGVVPPASQPLSGITNRLGG
ncbi:hypothetical protein AB0F71_18795 [Kitasatospora sp. NPDC028055]|uniref:hypothetical protein n=1 Tax=Kitasatospora sp. NPDC028055 TaxID=3155653 RepID=UPI0033DE5AF4